MKGLSGSVSEGSPVLQHLQFGGDAARAGGGNRGAQLFGGFGGGLVGHQAGADLGHGAGRDHGLGALAGEAAADAVHFEGWPRPETLE